MQQFSSKATEKVPIQNMDGRGPEGDKDTISMKRFPIVICLCKWQIEGNYKYVHFISVRDRKRQFLKSGQQLETKEDPMKDGNMKRVFSLSLR